MADPVLRRTGREIGRVVATVVIGLLILLSVLAVAVGMVFVLIG